MQRKTRHDRDADNRRAWTCNYNHICSERKVKKKGGFGSKLIKHERGQLPPVLMHAEWHTISMFFIK
jgi:hypothetical protein